VYLKRKHKKQASQNTISSDSAPDITNDTEAA